MHTLWLRVMKLFGVVVLAIWLLSTTASSQSPTFDVHARDSTAAIHAFDEASRLGVSLKSPDIKTIDAGARNVDPTTERVVGYAALAAGVIAITILAIGFYKLFRLFGG